MEKQEQSWLLRPGGKRGEVKTSSKDFQKIPKIFPKV
jgi:hypothetical protein